MKKIALIFTFLFFSIVNGQNKSIEFPIEENGEKSFAYKYFKKILDNLNLEQLEKSEKGYHFRQITPKYIIEIWKSENGKIAGKTFSFVEKESDSINLKNETKKIYFVIEDSIKTKNAIRIYKRLNKLKLENYKSTLTPLQNSENKISVILEFSNKESYKFKEFWYLESTENQNSLNKKLNELNLFMSEILNYEKLNENLMKRLPKGCFNLANGFVKCNN